MATFTENYNLIKPSEEDYYDVQDFNENMDAIDGQMAETEQELNGIGEKINQMDEKLGTTADTGTETIFGRLSGLIGTDGGIRVVKSIQHIVTEFYPNHGGVEEALNEVDPPRCIVIWQRLQDRNNMEGKVVYSLSPTKLNVDLVESSSALIALDFWIIEFY